MVCFKAGIIHFQGCLLFMQFDSCLDPFHIIYFIKTSYCHNFCQSHLRIKKTHCHLTVPLQKRCRIHNQFQGITSNKKNAGFALASSSCGSERSFSCLHISANACRSLTFNNMKHCGQVQASVSVTEVNMVEHEECDRGERKTKKESCCRGIG